MAIKDLLVVSDDPPTIDGCPALGRFRAFVVDQGVRAILQHQLTDRQGKAIDLSDTFDDGQSISQAEGETYRAIARIKEPIATGSNPTTNPIWELNAWIHDATQGVVRAKLSSPIVEEAGIYEVGWAIIDPEGEPLLVNASLMAVEQGLFARDLRTVADGKGPPTIQEIRQTLLDTCPADNTLLDSVEYTAEQIMYAILQPVEDWNVAGPNIRVTYTTRDYPYRNPWKEAIIGHLLVTAAHNYRRNHLSYQAGGTAVDDKNKEQPYLQMGLQLLQGYKDFVLNKKVSLNMAKVYGIVGSSFGRYRY